MDIPPVPTLFRPSTSQFNRDQFPNLVAEVVDTLRHLSGVGETRRQKTGTCSPQPFTPSLPQTEVRIPDTARWSFKQFYLVPSAGNPYVDLVHVSPIVLGPPKTHSPEGPVDEPTYRILFVLHWSVLHVSSRWGLGPHPSHVGLQRS